jgi:curli biogenesis system outer membrane secretion channel CsgG
MKALTCKVFVFWVFTSFLVGCATPKEGEHFEFATSRSKPNITIKSGSKLGILPFNSVVPSIGIAVSDVIGTHMIDSPFTVLERAYLSNILQERGYSVAGITQSTNYKEIGNLAGVDYIIVGDVAVRSARWQRITGATARLVDVSNGEVLISATYTPPKKGWAAPQYMGESLAEAIKREVAKTK